jgi:hypothetical protein
MNDGSIPLWLSHLPVVGGMAVPWITAVAPDGRHLFGALDPHRQRQAITGWRCQVCGRVLDRPLVLLMRLRDVPRRETSEPGLHPQCAAYTAAACPMVAGRMRHYRSAPIALGGGAVASTDPARLGAPAEPWFAVWLATYRPRLAPGDPTWRASYAGIRALRIRPVGAGDVPR